MSKIVLIGDGAVGSTFAYTLLVRGLVNELAIIDVNRDKVEGDVMDLNHGLMLAHPMKIKVGDYSDCAGADIIVITAGSAQRPGETRINLMQRNVKIFESIIGEITKYTKDAILLVATNPVDILTKITLKLSGFPKNRVLGSGTLLDSSRFRYLVGEYLGVDPRSVHGMIVGEHGDTELPLWSTTSLPGFNLVDVPQNSRWYISEEKKKEIYEETKNAAYKIIEKKGATFYAIALALTRICEAILKDQHSVLQVSAYLENYHGISDVCVGVPCVVGKNGIIEVVPTAMTAEEEKLFQDSANQMKEFLNSIGF